MEYALKEDIEVAGEGSEIVDFAIRRIRRRVAAFPASPPVVGIDREVRRKERR